MKEINLNVGDLGGLEKEPPSQSPTLKMSQEMDTVRDMIYSQYIMLVTGKDGVQKAHLDFIENKAGYHFAPGPGRFAQVSP